MSSLPIAFEWVKRRLRNSYKSRISHRSRTVEKPLFFRGRIPVRNHPLILAFLFLMIGCREQASYAWCRKPRICHVHLRRQALLYRGFTIRVLDLIKCLREFNEALIFELAPENWTGS